MVFATPGYPTPGQGDTSQPMQRQLQRLSTMERRRMPRFRHWQDITKFLMPSAGAYLATERDDRVDRFQDILDETAIHAAMVLESSMMSLRTNPTLPWHRSRTPDDDLNRYAPVRRWLWAADEMARRILRRSNSYVALPHLYLESAIFGTAATIMVDDFNTVIHHHLLTAGEFYLATDSRGRVDTLYREFRMTPTELAQEFGKENLSVTVRNMLDNPGSYDDTVPIIHAIERRDVAEQTVGFGARGMPWKSCYFERDGDREKYLRVSGHRQFPCLTPRWKVLYNDVYGEGPGTVALGSIRELQEVQLSKAKVIDYQTDPPLQIPTAAKGRDRDLYPGGRLPYDQNNPNGGVRTAFENTMRLDWAQVNIDDVRARINRSFYVPQFQPISTINDSTQRTAEEIIQRRAEMLTVLGPVTIRFQSEIDEPLLDRIYARMFEENLLPPPPPELNGMPLDIEFTGPLAQALKNEQANVNRSFRMHLGEIAVLRQDVVDNYDADADIDRTADLLGVDPSLIVPGEQVALIRQARAEAEAAAAQAQTMALGAKSMKDLAGASTSEQNALTDVLAGASG